MEGQIKQTAVVYFSITDHSKRAATRLAEMLGATLIALNAPRYAPGVLGYIRAGADSLRQKCVHAPQSFTSLTEFDHVVLCGPVWTSYPATPLRALLRSEDILPASVSVFLTSGDHSPAEKAWRTAANDLGRHLIACASLSNSVQDRDEANQVFERFVAELLSSKASTEQGDGRPIATLQTSL